MTTLRQKMKDEMTLFGLAESTQDKYLKILINLRDYYDKSPAILTHEEVRQYLLHLKTQKKLSDNTYNVQVYALRFFYCNVLKRPRYRLYLPTTKVSFKLPSILSVQEVECLIKACDNLKHQTLLMVVYGVGLRICEALNLKICDIDRDRQTLRIRNTKNRRERYVPLSPVILQALTDYWQAYRFTDYVFPGSKSGKALSQTSVAKLFKAAKKVAGIKKDGGIHSLRHSFAIHTLEAGADLIAIKRLLGHRSIHSTVRYCEYSPNYDKRFKSPIEALAL